MTPAVIMPEPVDLSANGFVFRTYSWPASGPADTGEAVLLLHGFPESSATWRLTAPLVAASGRRTVAVDLRGYSPGARPSGTERYAGPELASDVAAIVAALGGGPVHLVGHDWGAAIGWQVAGRHPEVLRTLSAVSVPHPGAFSAALRESAEQREASAYIRLFRQPGKAEQVLREDGWHRLRAMWGGAAEPEDVEAHLGVLAEEGALTAALEYYRAMGPGFEKGMGPVACPTLFVWPDADPAITYAAAERCGDYVRGPYRFEVLAGVSHWAPEQAPMELAHLLIAHFASAGPPAR